MDIKDLNIEYINNFCFIYNGAKRKFGKNIETDNLKKQIKIKNWMLKAFILDQDYPESITNYLKNLDAKEFIAFFESCDEYISLNGDVWTQQITKTCEELPESVKNAFFHLFDHEFYVKDDFKLTDDVLKISVVSTASYEENLILSGAKFSNDSKFDTFCFFENASLTKEDGIYKLTGEAALFDDEEFPLSVTFTSAKTEFISLNPTNSYFECTPWEQLLHVSLCILDKEDFENSFNELEIDLLPLLKEIKLLLFDWDKSELSTPIFEAFVKKYKFFELLPLIEKTKIKNLSDKRRNFITQQLLNKLNLIKYKPLWQEIFDLISESQKDYPFEIAIKKSKGTITKFKNKVTNLMQEYGFDGVYPDFYKKSAVKGAHLFESYNMSYTALNEKNAVHHIRCEEFINENSIDLSFMYGTEFLKSNQEMTDINACRFNCKGKKYASRIRFDDYFDTDKKIELEEKVKIVTKKAEFKKLTKEEKSKTFNLNYSLSDKFALFLITFIFSGFFFASLFIPAMMAFSAFMSWIEGEPVIISDIPWLILYFATWVLFGLPMGIVTVFSKK
jgi:hypothetical protein